MSSKHKIIRIVGFEKAGYGAQNHIFRLSRYMRARGHEDIMLCPHGSIVDDFKQQGGEVISLKNGMGGWASFWEIARIIKREKPSIVHTHMPWADSVGGMAASCGGGARIVTTIHGFYFTNSKGAPVKPFKRWLYGRRLTWGHHHVITISNALKNWMMEGFKVPERRITTINVGIELKDLPPGFDPAQKRRELGLEERDFVVAAMARLEPAKGQDIVIKALPLVLKEYPQVKVLILGEGSERADLERKAREGGVADKVKFLGYRRDVQEILGTCQAFIQASIREGLSNAILEALYRELPVMGSRHGGIPEALEDGVSGVLFAPRDPQALADVWLKIIREPAWAKELGEKGRERVRQRFSVEGMVSAIEKVYEQMWAR